MDSTPPRTPRRTGFLTRRPIFPLWIVQPLSTSPDDSHSASCCKTKTIAAFVNMYGDRESKELLRLKGCAKSWYMGFIAKMFECISSNSGHLNFVYERHTSKAYKTENPSFPPVRQLKS
ncbi:hypothetical protein K443DRAFT_289823 [Laccaria amethystina LaAM-08-1]|uniref:Uncharacterized protein n=1 Tax=Laccaria amethystina LaAM-08-1 TaxID=1095629 RepID=A0A0C9Y7S3_9AGAR|nr:hypothetical protein K443DRAFT_289823 [Laccaria amethystina LaAM-08-1]